MSVASHCTDEQRASLIRVLTREPAETYHARRGECLTSHRLAEFRSCPLLFRRKEMGLIPERDSHAFLVGRAGHMLILEGRERYEAEYAVGGPINPRTGQPFGSNTKAFAAWAEKRGKPVLADTDAAMVEQMAASVREHLFARELLAEGVAEGVVRGRMGGVLCQARLDWVNPTDGRGLVDLKTTDSLDSFERHIDSFQYLHQLAFYRALLASVGGVVLPVHIIAVEKREPFRCGVWQIAPRCLDAAQAENDRAIEELVRCRETGRWPTRFESLRLYDRIPLPPSQS
ncbi:MAG: PD-(D/E)XK nuclease-like domain-containing protein [Phycisphaerales bacterium]|nr:PD-(D/E)XK nuclease-like domain-containing protein [Phycisphaerales bacterium]